MTITIPKPQEVKQKQHRIEVQKDTSAPSEPSVSRSGPAAGPASSTTSAVTGGAAGEGNRSRIVA